MHLLLVWRELNMVDSIDERLQAVRDEVFNDINSYRICIERVKDGLRLIKEGRIPKNITDTRVERFRPNIKKLYERARKISEKYSDPNGDRTRELNRLDILVTVTCDGVKR